MTHSKGKQRTCDKCDIGITSGSLDNHKLIHFAEKLHAFELCVIVKKKFQFL